MSECKTNHSNLTLHYTCLDCKEEVNKQDIRRQNIQELTEKDNRIQELEKVALELAAETLDGVVRYEPARRIMELLGRCMKCGNNIFDADSICQVCLEVKE